MIIFIVYKEKILMLKIVKFFIFKKKDEEIESETVLKFKRIIKNDSPNEKKKIQKKINIKEVNLPVIKVN
jgi:hypothetical protein